MKAVDISIFGSAFRTKDWISMYNSIGKNDVSFEIVFVGPKEPNFKLPDNFRFIKSYTKIAQCYEIASRNCTGNLLLPICDDIEFKTERPLDRLFDIYNLYDDNKTIVSCTYMKDGNVKSIENYRFFYNDARSPLLPFFGLMSKKIYRKIGGIDKNFIAIQWEMDIAMRILSLGGKVIMTDVYAEELKSKREGSHLCQEFWGHDRKLIEDLWSKNGRVTLDRTKPVEPFSDIKILEETQGPNTRWK